MQTQYAQSLEIALAARSRKALKGWEAGALAPEGHAHKSLGLRHTLHTHGPEGWRLVHGAVGAAMHARHHRRMREFPLYDGFEIERRILELLAEGPLSRAELYAQIPGLAELPGAGWGRDIAGATYLGGLKVVGRGATQRFALASLRPSGGEGPGVRGPGFTGLESLLRAYLRGYGPATVRDFAYWTGFPQRDVRPAFEVLAGEIELAEGGFVLRGESAVARVPRGGDPAREVRSAHPGSCGQVALAGRRGSGAGVSEGGAGGGGGPASGPGGGDMAGGADEGKGAGDGRAFSRSEGRGEEVDRTGGGAPGAFDRVGRGGRWVWIAERIIPGSQSPHLLRPLSSKLPGRSSLRGSLDRLKSGACRGRLPRNSRLRARIFATIPLVRRLEKAEDRSKPMALRLLPPLTFVLLAALAPARVGVATYAAPVLPEVQRHLDDGWACVRHDPAKARAHAMAVLGEEDVAVTVDLSGVRPSRRTACRAAVDSALEAWTTALDDTVRLYRADDRRQSGIVVRFQNDVRERGAPVAGYVNWKRTADAAGGGVTGTVQVRDEDLDGSPMPARAMGHIVLHEMGHLLGLDDSDREGDAMGPLNVSRPVSAPTRAEAEAVQDLRADAARLLREARA